MSSDPEYLSDERVARLSSYGQPNRFLRSLAREVQHYRAIPTPEGVPLDQWVQTLVETLREVRGMVGSGLDRAMSARIDAVLRMAGEQ